MTLVLLIAAAWTVLAVAGGMLLGHSFRAGGEDAGAGWIDEVERFLGEQPGARTSG